VTPDFAVVTAYVPVAELLPIARAADRWGYGSLTVADHVVDLESIATPYPYEESGERRWSHEADWPDPWVAFAAAGAVTERLRFLTTIYVAALRSPYQVAKSVGTAAALTGGRVSLGVGVGWCREEFDLLEQDFGSRGRRTDDALALMRRLWEPGWTEHDGPHYPTPRLQMNPTPPGPVPILVGGLSEVALRRAARHDGWVGDVSSTAAAVATAATLRRLREDAGREGPYAVVAALDDAFLPEHFAAAGEGGVTDCMVMPWVYYHGFDATLEQKLEGLERFHDDVIAPLRGTASA